MDLLKKNISLTMFTIKEFPVIDNDRFYEQSIKFAARKLEDCRAGDIDCGWTVGNDVLSYNFSDDNCLNSGCHIFNLRRTERKAPSKLVEAAVERQCKMYMEANGTKFVSSKTRKEIKADVRSQLDAKADPILQWAQVIIEVPCQRVYVLATSQVLLDVVTLHLLKSFGIKLETVSPTMLASIEGLGNVGWGIGREFLTWCLWQGEKMPLELTAGFIQFSINAPLDFVYDEEQGFKVGIATDIAAKGDGAPICNETQTALVGGKTLKKAVLNICLERKIWSGTFDADRFAWSSLALPECESDETVDIIAEKILLIGELYDLLKQRFQVFAADYRQKDYQIRRSEWIRNRATSIIDDDNDDNTN